MFHGPLLCIIVQFHGTIGHSCGVKPQRTQKKKGSGTSDREKSATGVTVLPSTQHEKETGRNLAAAVQTKVHITIIVIIFSVVRENYKSPFKKIKKSNQIQRFYSKIMPKKFSSACFLSSVFHHSHLQWSG